MRSTAPRTLLRIGPIRRAALLALLLALALIALMDARATAAPGVYALDWFTVDAGGAIGAANGGYALSGTIGQPDASPPAAVSRYALSSGFWLGAAPNRSIYLPLLSKMP